MATYVEMALVVHERIYQRFAHGMLAFVNDAEAKPNRLYACPLVQVEEPRIGEPYRPMTVQTQTNAVRTCKVNGEPNAWLQSFVKAHPEVLKVHTKHTKDAKGHKAVGWFKTK